jgi:dethiobiotin synthetase
VKRLFITGTDTGIGKTYVACELIRHLVGEGESVAAMKPVASGSEQTAHGLRNEDALALMEAINVDLSYQQVNPFVFEPAIAPHIAAHQAGVVVDLSVISAIADSVVADTLVIEGAGGWCVPLNENDLMADLVNVLKSEVILVVGMQLGCINHALLSARQIIRDGCKLAGWIANGIDPEMPEYRNNLITLSKLMPVPLIAEIPWRGKIKKLI